MSEFTEWRGFDLRKRRAKIERAFRLEEVTAPEVIPLIINTPCYYAFASRQMPEDYFTDPAAMVAYQEQGFLAHLAQVDDDTMPYFMPWFGTGVLASGFGCEIRISPEPGSDPAVASPCVTSPHQAAHLKLPDPKRDGWMPRVLDTIDYARTHSDLPVGLTDMQGPLDTLGLMCGQAQLYQWMYREPQMVHELFDLVTRAFIEWVKAQKEHIGEPLTSSNGLQGVWSPEGVGIWESDDDLVLIDARLYGEFVAPQVGRIFEAFGGGSVHFCGSGLHQIDNLLGIKNLKVVNTSPLGKFEAFAALRRRLSGRALVQIQDAAPIDVEQYYQRLFEPIDDFRGLMLATFVTDTIGMDMSGGYAPVERDPFATANRIAAAVRDCVRRKMAGETLVAGVLAEPLISPSAGIPAGPAQAGGEAARPAFPDAQEQALEAVRRRLIDFDGKGLRAAVQAALQTGLEPFEIITHGMAQAVSEVGRRYEAGDFYLPELVMAGGTLAEGMAVLQPLLKGQASGKGKGTVVIGTVRGDLHDIGKNLVKTLLEAAGFLVIDIGVDQPAEAFVEKARHANADIVAMSALLTTTMANMAQVVTALRLAGLPKGVRVMVGGAPISRQFADRIGAEGYAPDAVKAVREAERLMAISDENAS